MPSRKPNKEEELFVDNLNYFLECMGYQDKELCSLLHVNAATVSSYLNKKRRIPDEHRKTISDLMKFSEQFLSSYNLRDNRKFSFKEYYSLSDINVDDAINGLDKAFSEEFAFYETIFPTEDQDEFLKPVKRFSHFLNKNLKTTTYTDERFVERLTYYLEETLIDYGQESIETDEKFLSELLYLICIFRSIQVKERSEEAYLRFSARNLNVTRWVIADLSSHNRHTELASFLVWFFYTVGYFAPFLDPNGKKAVAQECFDWLLFTNNKYASAIMNNNYKKAQDYVRDVLLDTSSSET